MKSKFSGIRKMLTRDEMKQIKGGTGWSTCGNPCGWINQLYFGSCGDYTFICNVCNPQTQKCGQA